jgi:MFS family permease
MNAIPQPEADAHAAPSGRGPSAVQQRGMRAVIIGQMVGNLGSLAFSNGILLLFLAKVGFGGASALLLLALPSIIQPLLILPLAHLAERSHRRMMMRGFALSTVGFLLLSTLGWGGWHGRSVLVPVVSGIVIYALGVSMSTASWYALLDPLVPRHMRGSFFGTLRLSWRFYGFAFGIVCTFLLGLGGGVRPLELILILITIGMAARVLLMRQVPDAPTPPEGQPGLLEALSQVARIPGYAGFCCYVFLLTLVTDNAVTLLPLIERDSVGFSDTAVVWMGSILGIGSVVSFYFCGKLVDRIGTRPVFLLCHGCFAALFFAVLLRGCSPLSSLWWMGIQNLLYGIAGAGVSVAVSTEMLALVPAHNKGLSTGLCSTLQLAGAGLSGLLGAGAIKLGILSGHWQLGRTTLSAYDTLILGDAVLVVLLVVTLGLVPSVMAARSRPAQGPT